MKLSIFELTHIFTAFKGKADTVMFGEVVTDSRKKSNKGLFVPIIGERFDAHEYLLDAIDNGAIASLWQEDIEVPKYVPTDFPLFFVKDTVQGLQQIAKYYLNQINPTVIGITGSNGKTTTKDLVYSVVYRKYKAYRTKGNYNNHIGLPLTILSMPDHTELLILEMGMNHFGEISVLSKIAEPDFAIITNIGESHIEHLGSREGIAKAKLEIVDGLKSEGKLIIDGDEPLLKSKYNSSNTVTCGLNENNEFQLSFIASTEHGLQFTINDEQNYYDLPILGKHNARNAVFAIALARLLDVPDEQIKEGLKELSITGMRLERFLGLNSSLIINDAYNSSPTSMKAAIETIKTLHAYSRKMVVLGDMYELGTKEEELHRSVSEVISSPITDCITIGEKASWISDELKGKEREIQVYSFHDKKEAISKIKSMLSSNTVVLLKASRGAKFETIVEEIKQ